jgi:soluble lytic murein transglycosylase-like protein
MRDNDPGRFSASRTVSLAAAILLAAPLAAPAGETRAVSPPPAAALRLAPAAPTAAVFAAQVHAHLAERMPRLEPGARARLGEAIVMEATLARLDPLLVLAVIQVESSFDPAVRSSSGAVGLMQLLGPTMKAEAERSGLPSADPRDPIANVQAGVRYLKRLVDAFGSVDVALMAYNAGPNRILSYLRQGGIRDGLREYPRRVRAELDRLRSSATQLAAASGTSGIAAD